MSPEQSATLKFGDTVYAVVGEDSDVTEFTFTRPMHQHERSIYGDMLRLRRMNDDTVFLGREQSGLTKKDAYVNGMKRLLAKATELGTDATKKLEEAGLLRERATALAKKLDACDPRPPAAPKRRKPKAAKTRKTHEG